MALWAGALSWCSIQTLFFQRFGRFFYKVCRTASLFIPTMSAIILTLRCLPLRTISLIFQIFWSVFEVEGWPRCKSSSTSSRPSLNLLCHWNTREHDIKISPYTSFNNKCAPLGMFFLFHKKFQINTLLNFFIWRDSGKLTVQCSLQTGLNNKLNWTAC